MTSDPCPPRDDLWRFLNEELETVRLLAIGTHVDTCHLCQEMLDELTRGRAYGLSVLGRDPIDVPAGDEDDNDRKPAPEDDDDTEHAGEGMDSVLKVEPTDLLSGEAPGDDDRTETPGDPDALTVDMPRTDPDRTEDLPQGSAHQNPEPRPAHATPTIAAYEILGVIREGGMGVVYRARQRGLNRLVALKMIRGDRARSDHFARFRIEAEAVARLTHPNIIQIHEIGETNGLPFLSLELLEGGTLEDRLAGTPQPGRSAAELMATIARAVQVAHDAGIIHRDLKPSNVLFTDESIPKVTDFGLAKRLESDSKQTETGQIMGTPCYMAPEQARGHTKDVGPLADVYALGSIFYEMLTGRPPFKGEAPLETVRQVVEDEVVPPSRLVPKVPRDLETICLHCLNKEPSRRYHSARALALDLDNFLAGRPIKARRTPMWERGVKLARRRPVAATLLTLGLIAIVGLSGAWMRFSWLKQQSELQKSLRLTERQGNVFRTLLESQDLLNKGKWIDAEVRLTKLRAEIRDEPGLDDLARQTDDLLEQAGRERSEQENRSRDQGLLQTFLDRRREAFHQETHSTWLGVPSVPEKVRISARLALAVFAAPSASESWELRPLPPSLRARQHDEIKEGCYELLLILASAEEQPEVGLRLLDNASKLRSPTRAYHLRRAECLARRGDATSAENERSTAAAVPLDSALDHFLIGKELHSRGDWSAALAHFDTTLSQQPGHFWAHCLSADCYVRLGKPIQAKAELNACLQTEPGLAWLYELRGFVTYQIAGLARAAAENLSVRGSTLRNEIELQLQAAEADYRRALQLLDVAPDQNLRYVLLARRGLLWLERRVWDKAEADLQAAIRLDDRRWEAFELLAQTYQSQNKSDKAIDQFTLAIHLGPGLAPLYRAQAATNMARKEPTPAHRASALADLEQAIRLDPARSPILALDHTSRARLLRHESREEEALAACNAALAIDPDYPDAHRLRLDLLRKLKRFDDMVKSCDSLLARGKPSAEIYEFRGLAKEKLRDYQGAIEDNTLAIALHPGSAPLLAKRGALYLVTDAPRSALRDIEQSIRLDPSSADAYLARGLALAALGQHREAIADAAKALGMSKPTAPRLYNAARIHAEAAIAAAAEARKRGQDAVSQVNRYHDQAMQLLAEWFKRLPSADRSAALRDLLQDPAMATLRRRLRSLELTGANASSAAPAGQPRP